MLLFPWVVFALAQLRRKGMEVPDAAPLVAREWTALCWIWAASITLFFSIPNSKLVGYVLPAVPPLALLAALGWQRSMARFRRGGQVFAALCVVNIGVALAIVTQVGEVTRSGRTRDLAQVLACAAAPTDTIYVTGAYPYDLPFYAQTSKPMVVLENWSLLRSQAGDGWQRELFEGADFDAQASRLLQAPEVLVAAGLASGNWLVLRIGSEKSLDLSGWKRFYEGAGWLLYQSAPALTAKSPEPAQHIGLPGCQHQRQR